MSIIDNLRGIFTDCRPKCIDCDRPLPRLTDVVAKVESRDPRVCGSCWAVRISNGEDA